MTRRPLRAFPSNANKSTPFALPPPVGGWNARDALATMPATDAERLDNWFPDTTWVSPRAGSLTYTPVLNGDVKTAIQYASGSTVKLLVASTGALVAISTSGTAGAATVATGYGSDQWQGVNFGAGGGNYLIMANGTDLVQAYNGASASAQAFTVADGSLTSTFTNVNEFQQRLYFTKSNSLKFYYVKTANAISGSVESFDLSGIMSSGGELRAMGTWTRDSGAGMDDLAVFISSQGQAAVYQGTDPTSATTWALVGVYSLPAPLGYRCVEKFGGDLVVLTGQGVLPMSAIVGGPLQQGSYITDKIRKAFAAEVAYYRNTWGWQVKYFAEVNWLLVNIPSSPTTTQFVMNTNTGAWCRFLGFEALCWESFRAMPMLGVTGKVIQANYGTNDDGADIQIDAKQAATTCDQPGRQKKWNLFRPHLATNGDLPITVGVNIDFSDVPPTSVPTPIPVNYPYWDQALWDTQFWGDSAQIVSSWYSAGGYGTYGAVRLTGAVNTETIQWFGTDIVTEAGGLL
ncbi:hypothetical protein UFOVP1169_6 [uncultured Caudovirales phage]|uniref:Uncharacterized protein n=1 Tax=uncultured Caudovirales phage TaxID=2100421 RepID=A0A6J5QZ00_9CAUD|nr:hypothetical protein UFOVP1169_6 [uncultured Caudovirales phage]